MGPTTSAELVSVTGAVLTHTWCLKWSTAPVDRFVTESMPNSHCDPNPDPSVWILTCKRSPLRWKIVCILMHTEGSAQNRRSVGWVRGEQFSSLHGF